MPTPYLALGVDVANISGDTWCESDIVERKLGNSWVELQEEGQRLADTTCGTEDDNLGGLYEFES